MHPARPALLDRPHAGLARRASTVATTAAALLLVAAGPASAHEAWFVEHPSSYPLDWTALAAPATVAGIGVALVLAWLWRAVAARAPQPELAALRPLQRLAPWVPRLLGVHLGVSLLALSAQGAVLDPSVQAGTGPSAALVLLPQVAVGVLLVAGVWVRAAALAVVAAGPVLVALHGARGLLLCAVLVGIALFLALVPPQRTNGGKADLATARLWPALLALRLGAAVSLISLAVAEKLANPAMGVAMLEQQPVLNLLAPVGVSSEQFVLVAGTVELLFGLLVLSGAAPQVVGLVAAVPFTASLALFGTTELIGHLPVYGVLLVLVVLGSSAATAGDLRRLRPPRPSAAPAAVSAAVSAAAPDTVTA